MTIPEYIDKYFPVLASWAIGCGGAYSLIQTIKLARRECGARRVAHWLLRLMAFLFAGGITTIVAYKLFDMPPDIAVVHGALVGVLYPLLMTAVMAKLKSGYPELYDKLRVPTRRPGDKPHDLNDSGQFF